MNLFESLQLMKENDNQIKPYGGDNKNWAMFYVPDNKRSDIIKYAKDKGFDKIYWGSDEALGYGLKGGYNGDTLVVFKDANLLPDGYKEDAIKYGKLIDENIEIKKESYYDEYDRIIAKIKSAKNMDELLKIDKDIQNSVYARDAQQGYDRYNNYSSLQIYYSQAIKDMKNKESKEIKNESFDKKAILHKIDLFAKQITIDKSNMKDMEELLRSKHIDYQVDADSKPNKATFYLIYKENVNNIKNESKYNSNINTSDELYIEIQKILRDTFLDEDTISLNDLFNCYSTDDLQDLYDFIATEYDYDNDYVGIITNSNNLWYEFNKLLTDDCVKLDDIFNCFSFDKLKELYDYLLSEYQDDWDEDGEDLEEATSGIGGAYTTQAIDILPKINQIKPKHVKENLYDEYLERIMDEKNNSNLVKLLNEIKDNKGLKDDDKKKLKKEIKDKFKTLKTEAVTKFYGKDFDDDVIKDKIEFTKAHPQEFMALKYLDTFEYEGVTYYVASEDKRITYDEKECVVYLVYDENLNKYLAYFEVTLNDFGDAENGPDLQMKISEVPYKIVSI